MSGSGRAWPRIRTFAVLAPPTPSTAIDQSSSPPTWKTLTSGTALSRRLANDSTSVDDLAVAARRADSAAAPDMTERV